MLIEITQVRSILSINKHSGAHHVSHQFDRAEIGDMPLESEIFLRGTVSTFIESMLVVPFERRTEREYCLDDQSLISVINLFSSTSVSVEHFVSRSVLLQL